MTTGAHSQISTLALTRKRGLSLSLVGKQSPSLLHDLPAEIIIHILELALLHDRPRDLASVSQVIRHFINTIIYRTVVLDTPRAITLFHRTASSARSSHLLEHVRRLAITWEPEYFSATTEEQLRGIVAQCPSIRAVAVPSCYQVNISPSGARVHDGPTDLTVQSFEDLNPDPLSSAVFLLPAYFSASLTHLRICEPGDKWQSPLSMIAAFHGAPNLTHLELARRTDSNEENDAIFVEDLAYLLTTRKTLKMVVVSIFGGSMRTSLEALRESSIWMLVSGLREVDSRVVITQGEPGSWREEWKDVKGFWCGRRPANFWDTVREQRSQEVIVG